MKEQSSGLLTPEQHNILDKQSKAFWAQSDVDLIVRKQLLEEYDPKPLGSVASLRVPDLKRIYKYGLRDGVLARKEKMLEIKAQEERLRGRNRFATPEQRLFILLQGRAACSYCGVMVKIHGGITNPLIMQSDHIERFDGSNTVVHNLACSCQACNVLKSTSDPIQFMESIDADIVQESVRLRDELYGPYY